jgi:hypothetical protein
MSYYSNLSNIYISRSTTRQLALEIIDSLGWTSYFSSFQIYPRSKDNHMHKIKEELKLDNFGDILFFDDESGNIKPTTGLGVKFHLVDEQDGVDLKAMLQGLDYFNSKH